MQSSTSAFSNWHSTKPGPQCSSRKGPRSTVFSLFNKIVIKPSKISCFALLFTKWRKQGYISSVICMSIVVSHAWVDHIESGGGPGTAKVNCMDTCCSGVGFWCKQYNFVEMVCKVQLNIVFNGLRVPDFERHRNGNSCFPCIKSLVRPGSPGSPGSKPDPKASLSPAIGWVGQAIKIRGSRS